MSLYGEIILNSEAVEIDRPFTYKIPESFNHKVKIGQIVKVPFGFRNKPVEGFIIGIKKEDEVSFNYKIKELLSIETEEPIITLDDVDLICFLKEKYLCKYIDAFRLLIPIGIMKGAKNKVKNVIVLA
ncbi:primosomal protein N', partial [Clostridium saudiense]|nr:primosomal protein N' [Clostridium saudiense]